MERTGDIRIECLDGLRGLAALWVFVGHGLILTGWRIPVLSHAGLGVDLFILLSGFLMAYHYRLREPKEPWGAASTWARFWTRRYFRIAPLYYVTLAAALLFGSQIFEARLSIDQFLGVEPQLESRYADASATNILLHGTFLFGLLPDYAFRTALPDWSIGLEMQFYAAFPFLMLAIRGAGWRLGALVLGGVGAAIALLLSLAGIEFPMPAFLPLKLHLFLAGMLLAGALGTTRSRTLQHLAIALLLSTLEGGTLSLVARLSLTLGFFWLLHHEVLPGLAGRLGRLASGILGTRPFHWLGELSYGTYLIHLLVMQPVVAYIISTHGSGIPAPARFAIVMAIVVPVVYALAYAGYRLFEVPGRNLGRSLLSRAKASPRSA